MNSRKARFTVVLWVLLLVISGITGFGQTVNLVENLDTGETFSSIQAAIEDSDTDEGDTIVVYPADQRLQGVKFSRDQLTLKSRDIPNRPTIEGKAETDETTIDGTYYEVITAAYGVHLDNSNSNNIQHFHLTEVSSLADADISTICGGETCSGDVYAGALSYGIRLDGSSDNTFRHIDMSEIHSKATASADSGDAEAISKSYGISLKNSPGNTFQYIDLNDISGQASANSNSGEEYTEVNTFGVDIVGSSNNTFEFNVISDNEFGVRSNSTGITMHYNNIVNNTNCGVKNRVDEVLDASLNWWGSSEGPSVDIDWNDLEYNGGGDLIKGQGPVNFSPWLSQNPDGDPDEPGIQLISPLNILVKRVGPVPTTENGNTGYLDMAIWGAKNVPEAGKIIVAHGSYEASESISNNVELLSTVGTTCNTCLKDVENSELTVNGNAVSIGKLDGFTPRGFVIKDEIVTGADTDASTVHLHWNDLRNTVTNNGNGRLDAEYNWWGDLDPSDNTTGMVDYRPFLPEEPCSFSNYMKKHDIKNPRAAVADNMLRGGTCSDKLPARLITNYHLKPREAEELVDEYGCYTVRNAIDESGDNYNQLKAELG